VKTYILKLISLKIQTPLQNIVASEMIHGGSWKACRAAISHPQSAILQGFQTLGGL